MPTPLLLAWLGTWMGSFAPQGTPVSDGYLFPARGVEASTFTSDATLSVDRGPEAIAFTPTMPSASVPRVLFLPGGGVDPDAYAPLARRMATEGIPVLIVRTEPARRADAATDAATLERVEGLMKAAGPEVRWLVCGHSRGAALATKLADRRPPGLVGLVLLATTHPRDVDLSDSPLEITRVLASNDRVAPPARAEANAARLPKSAHHVLIQGGNHAQFGHYGPQPGDGRAAIDPDEQERQAAAAIVESARRLAVAR
jgi:pimeloyl-ACP methyl ester carboxylesterase